MYRWLTEAVRTNVSRTSGTVDYRESPGAGKYHNTDIRSLGDR